MIEYAMKLIAKYWQPILLALFCLTPLVWFLGKDPGILINGLDTNFPLDPLIWFKRRFFVWNDTINAGVDFSSSTAGLFFHFIQVTPYILGFSLKNVEIFSMVFWFSAVVLSSFLLARIVVPKSKIAQIVFVAIYSFNIYLFNTWENVKVANLSLVASVPLFVWIIYQWSQKAISGGRAFVYLCLASILSSGSGINPAYFSVIVLVILIQGIILRKIKIPAVSVFTLLLINLFWILPLLSFLLSNRTKSLEDLGLTNWLESLSENTSITNVVRLQGAWDWYALDKYGMPQYLPYTLNYLYKWPFIIFSFAVPVLAFTSFLFVKSKRRFWYIFFGVLAFLGIFLGVGAHAPTGGILFFLYKHIPFLSFFRSPWYIFTPFLILAYAGLTGILFEELIQRFRLAGILGFLFLIPYGIYNYPLITGKIFRPDKEGFYVKFPVYVFDAKRWISKNGTSERRIISYPDDDLESFSWGYKGTESVLSLFSDREVVAPSFNISSKTFAFLLKDFYSHIKRGEYESAISVANFFSADTIFYKKDSPTLSPPITDEIKKFVSQTIFGDWVFMKANSEQNDKIYSPTTIYNNLSYADDTVFQVPLLAKGAAIVNGTVDTQIPLIPGSENYLSLLRAYTLGGTNEDLDTTRHYEFTLPKDGVYDFAIEKLYVDKNTIIPKIDSINMNRSLVSETDGFIKIGPMGLKKGTHVLEIVYPDPPNLLDTYDFSSFVEGAPLRKEELPNNPQKTLMAFSFLERDQVIKLPVGKFNPFLRYAIGFDYKYVYGSVPIFDIVQSAPTAPVKTHPIYPGSSMDWASRYEIFRPVETASKLELLIKLGPNKLGNRSKMFFENIFVKRIYDNKVFVIEKEDKSSGDLSTIEFRKVSPVKYEVKAEGGTILVFLESYSKGWSLRSKDSKSEAVPLHFTVNGYANGWYIPENLGVSDYIIYYQPQRLYLIGVLISVVIALSTFALALFKWKK